MSEVAIRFYRPEDAPELFEAARESVAEVYPWLDWDHPDYELAEAEQWLDKQVEERKSGRAFEFAILAPTGRYLGGCGVNLIDPVHRRANLGYWVRTSATGKGVATTAVRELAKWAFVETNLVRLEILTALGNTVSQRVAEKAGAQREGVARDRLYIHGKPHDAAVYSIIRSQWQPNDPDAK